MSDIEKCEAYLAEISDALRLKENENVIDDEMIRLMREKAHAMLDLADALEATKEAVDPDADLIEAIITAYRRSPECSTDSAFGEAMLDHLRERGYDVTRRTKQ